MIRAALRWLLAVVGYAIRRTRSRSQAETVRTTPRDDFVEDLSVDSHFAAASLVKNRAHAAGAEANLFAEFVPGGHAVGENTPGTRGAEPVSEVAEPPAGVAVAGRPTSEASFNVDDNAAAVATASMHGEVHDVPAAGPTAPTSAAADAGLPAHDTAEPGEAAQFDGAPPNESKNAFDLLATAVTTSSFPESSQVKEPVTSQTAHRLEAAPTETDSVSEPAAGAKAGTDEPKRSPRYRPPRPVSPTRTSRPPSASTGVSAERDRALRLRVQLAFARNGAVKTLAIIPDRRDDMPDEIEVTGWNAAQRLATFREDCYEPIALVEAASALRDGITFSGRGRDRRFRWVLSGREIYVLTAGDEIGFHGFVSTDRLRLRCRHAILARANRREEVASALTDAGCLVQEVIDNGTPGVPPGWVIFRDLVPTQVTETRDKADALNALCALRDAEPHFIGGIRIASRSWLAGFPPRIRFTGALDDDFKVKIDGRPAQPAADGAFEAPEWDSVGEHVLWYSGQTVSYELCEVDENWSAWQAYVRPNCAASGSCQILLAGWQSGAGWRYETNGSQRGAAICGAVTEPLSDGQCWHVRVPGTNPLLIGARPGDVYLCPLYHSIRPDAISVMVPFQPIWALPQHPKHADKARAFVLPLKPLRDSATSTKAPVVESRSGSVIAWIRAIRDAGCKGLRVATEDENEQALWRNYCAHAKRLRRRRP